MISMDTGFKDDMAASTVANSIRKAIPTSIIQTDTWDSLMSDSLQECKEKRRESFSIIVSRLPRSRQSYAADLKVKASHITTRSLTTGASTQIQSDTASLIEGIADIMSDHLHKRQNPMVDISRSPTHAMAATTRAMVNGSFPSLDASLDNTVPTHPGLGKSFNSMWPKLGPTRQTYATSSSERLQEMDVKSGIGAPSTLWNPSSLHRTPLMASMESISTQQSSSNRSQGRALKIDQQIHVQARPAPQPGHHYGTSLPFTKEASNPLKAAGLDILQGIQKRDRERREANAKAACVSISSITAPGLHISRSDGMKSPDHYPIGMKRSTDSPETIDLTRKPPRPSFAGGHLDNPTLHQPKYSKSLEAHPSAQIYQGQTSGIAGPLAATCADSSQSEVGSANENIHMRKPAPQSSKSMVHTGKVVPDRIIVETSSLDAPQSQQLARFKHHEDDFHDVSVPRDGFSAAVEACPIIGYSMEADLVKVDEYPEISSDPNLSKSSRDYHPSRSDSSLYDDEIDSLFFDLEVPGDSSIIGQWDDTRNDSTNCSSPVPADLAEAILTHSIDLEQRSHRHAQVLSTEDSLTLNINLEMAKRRAQVEQRKRLQSQPKYSRKAISNMAWNTASNTAPNRNEWELPNLRANDSTSGVNRNSIREDSTMLPLKTPTPHRQHNPDHIFLSLYNSTGTKGVGIHNELASQVTKDLTFPTPKVYSLFPFSSSETCLGVEAIAGSSSTASLHQASPSTSDASSTPAAAAIISPSPPTTFTPPSSSTARSPCFPTPPAAVSSFLTAGQSSSLGSHLPLFGSILPAIGPDFSTTAVTAISQVEASKQTSTSASSRSVASILTAGQSSTIDTHQIPCKTTGLSPTIDSSLALARPSSLAAQQATTLSTQSNIDSVATMPRAKTMNQPSVLALKDTTSPPTAAHRTSVLGSSHFPTGNAQATLHTDHRTGTGTTYKNRAPIVSHEVHPASAPSFSKTSNDTPSAMSQAQDTAGTAATPAKGSRGNPPNKPKSARRSRKMDEATKMERRAKQFAEGCRKKDALIVAKKEEIERNRAKLNDFTVSNSCLTQPQRSDAELESDEDEDAKAFGQRKALAKEKEHHQAAAFATLSPVLNFISDPTTKKRAAATLDQDNSSSSAPPSKRCRVVEAPERPRLGGKRPPSEPLKNIPEAIKITVERASSTIDPPSRPSIGGKRPPVGYSPGQDSEEEKIETISASPDYAPSTTATITDDAASPAASTASSLSTSSIDDNNEYFLTRTITYLSPHLATHTETLPTTYLTAAAAQKASFETFLPNLIATVPHLATRGALDPTGRYSLAVDMSTRFYDDALVHASETVHARSRILPRRLYAVFVLVPDSDHTHANVPPSGNSGAPFALSTKLYTTCELANEAARLAWMVMLGEQEEAMMVVDRGEELFDEAADVDGGLVRIWVDETEVQGPW